MADVFTTPNSGPVGEEEKDATNLGLAIALPVCLIVGVLLALLFFACVKYRYLFWKTDRSIKGPPSKEKSHFWIENALPAKHPSNDALSVNASIRSSSYISEEPGEWYRAIHQYEADEDGRLSLEIGQLVEVKEKLDTGWWLGFSNTDFGWFPATYVEPLSGHYNPGLLDNVTKDAALNKSSTSNGQKSPDAQKTYKAVCIYKPNGSDELAVQPGDSLLHVNRDPNGWVKVKNRASDLVGWVPMATLEEATAGAPNTPTTPMFKDGSENHITGIECISVYKYEARNEGDLSFDAGEPIVAFQILDNGWWRGYHNQQEGWFPGSYIQIVPQSPAVIDSGYTSPRTPNSRVRVNLEKSFEAAAVHDASHLYNSRNNEKVNGHRNPFFNRFNNWKDQMSSSKMFHPRVVRIRASQLKKRIGSQFKRNNVPPPPAPPKNSNPTVVMVSEPPYLHEMPSCSDENPPRETTLNKETTLTLEGFEAGETLDTGEGGDSTDGEFDDVPLEESNESVSSEAEVKTGLTTFDKIVIEKKTDPEVERKKKESLERAQKLLADLQKAAPRKYSGEPRESVTNQYLKNKERKLSQESNSASTFIKKISLDDDGDDAVFSLNMVETSVDIDSDSKSDSSDSAMRVDSNLVSKSDTESSKSTDDVTKGLISDKMPSTESRNSSWGSKRDVPVVAVRPVGHEKSEESGYSEIKLDIDGILNGESNTDFDNKKDYETTVTVTNEKTNDSGKTDNIFGDKWDYQKLFAGLDDFNPSFELETNIDDVIEDGVEDDVNTDLSKSRNSKDLRLLIPPPAEFVDFNDSPDETRQSEKPSEQCLDVSPSENNSSLGISYDRSVSVESESSPVTLTVTPTVHPVAPSRRRKKGPRPPVPPPPPPPTAEVKAEMNNSPLFISAPLSSSTPNSEASPASKLRTPVTPNTLVKPATPVTPKSPVRPSPPIAPPTVSAPMPPSREILRSPVKQKPNDKSVASRKSAPIPPSNPVRKSAEAKTLRQSLNATDIKVTKRTDSIHENSDSATTTRPLISAPISTREIEEKPQVFRAIPLNGQTSKNQTLPPASRNPAGLPKHLRAKERSKTLPHVSASLPASPSKSEEKTSPKRRAPLPPASAPVSPAKPPSPTKNLKVTFSEELVHQNKVNQVNSGYKLPARPPPPKQLSPTSPTSPTKRPSPAPPAKPTSPLSPTANGSPKKSILVRSKTDPEVGSIVDNQAAIDPKSIRRVWKSHSAMTEGELSLPQDSLLQELEAAPGKPGFIIGRTPDGRIGTFPKSYLKPVMMEEPGPDILLTVMEDTSISNIVF